MGTSPIPVGFRAQDRARNSRLGVFLVRALLLRFYDAWVIGASELGSIQWEIMIRAIAIIFFLFIGHLLTLISIFFSGLYFLMCNNFETIGMYKQD